MSRFAEKMAEPRWRELLGMQRAVLDRLMPSVVGYNLLQLSPIKGLSLCDERRVGHYVRLGYGPVVTETAGDPVWSDYADLPIANDCVDIVLLHHAIEFVGDQHQLLREAKRVLTAGGHLLVVGFNPYSLWPALRRTGLIRGQQPLPQRAISPWRLSEWFSLLNFDVLLQQSYCYLPPRVAHGEGEMDLPLHTPDKCALPVGLFYVLHARKRTQPVNIIRPQWMSDIASSRNGRRQPVIKGPQVRTSRD